MPGRSDTRRISRCMLPAAVLVLLAIILAPLVTEPGNMIRHAGARIATMISSLVSLMRLSAASEDSGIAHLTQVLGGEAGTGGAITIDIWCAPTAEGRAGEVPQPPRLLLYTPGSGKPRTDNQTTAAALAQSGYLVVALDDVERAPELADDKMPPLRFDFASEAAYDLTLRRGDEKTGRQAARLIDVLDRLTALQRSPGAPAWLEGVRLDRVGAFGWSLGGATAAEASVLDPRVRAVANLDGWLFGQAARGGVKVPYLLMLSDYPFPGDADLDDPVPIRRYEARLTRRDLDEERRLIQRPGNLGIRLPGAFHENLSDLALGAALWRSWSRVDPVRTKALVNYCLAAFFNRYLQQAPATGCLEEGYVAEGVQRLKTIEWPGSDTATAPM